MRKIIVRIGGGLGNQMFQYAYGKFLADAYNCKLILDTSPLLLDFIYCLMHCDFRFRRHYGLKPFSGPFNEHTLSFTMQLFSILMWIILQKGSSRIKKLALRTTGIVWTNILGGLPTMSHLSYLESSLTNGILCSGVPLDISLLPDRSVLRHYFAFPPINNADHTKLSDAIGDGEHWCSIHIRRSDYVLFCNQLDTSYHRAAIDHMRKNAKVNNWIFFSDDIEWCKQNFSDIKNAIFFTGDYKHPIEDLRFMSLCKHHIIANSTFSWWGAYLSDDTGVTIYPSSWYNADERATRIPKSWIAV